MSDDYDSPWKEILDVYFPEFLAFFFPGAHDDIDWTRDWENLEQELHQLMHEGEIGKRIADKLIKVWRREGEEFFVLVHIEVQGEPEEDFPERMYVYNYRTYDRYRRPVASLAVLADDNPAWRPERFGYRVWGCETSLCFPVVKLEDYNGRWRELERSANPFATVVMAHLKTRQTRKDPEGRYRWKLRLVRRLYERGFPRQDVVKLFRFIDWLLTLPKELDYRFRDDLERLEKEKTMPYVTSIERIGIEKGERQGQAALLQRQLSRRFGSLPDWVAARLQSADRSEIEIWADRLLDAERLGEIFAPIS